MKRLLRIILLATIFQLLTQTSNIWATNIDSLEQRLKTTNLHPAEKISVLKDLSYELASIDLRKAIHYAQEGIKLAVKTKDRPMIGHLHRNTGIAYYMFSQFDSAKIHFDKALEYAKQAGDQELELLTYSALGNLYNSKGNYPTSIEYYMKAIPLAQKTNNKKRQNNLYANLSGVYTRIENWELANKYLTKTIELSKEINDGVSLGQAYNSLSDLYLGQKNQQKAIEYEQLAIDAFRETGQTEFESIATQGMAMLYYDTPTPDYTKAEFWALRGLELSKASGLPRAISGAYCMLSNVYLQWNKNELAEKYALDAYRTDSTDSNLNSNIFGNLVWTSIRKGNTSEATRYMDLYRIIIDERATELYQSTISEMEVRNETQEKEVQIAVLLQQKKLYGIITIFIGITLCLLILMLTLYYRNARQKKTIAEQKIITLEQEKQLIATQSVLDGETAERSRLARDLHDGLGGMLSVVKLNLNTVKGNLTMQQTDVPSFQNAIEMLDNSISELRRVARNLMPEALSRYGLNAAISDFCMGIEHARFHYFGNNQRHPEKIETTLFRIVMELINNALKHSGATQINVQLIDEGIRISLLVQDNGTGFDPDITDTTKTTGLNSIRMRIQSLGGTMEMISSHGNGTEVHIDISNTEIL